MSDVLCVGMAAIKWGFPALPFRRRLIMDFYSSSSAAVMREKKTRSPAAIRY